MMGGMECRAGGRAGEVEKALRVVVLLLLFIETMNSRGFAVDTGRLFCNILRDCEPKFMDVVMIAMGREVYEMGSISEVLLRLL